MKKETKYFYYKFGAIDTLLILNLLITIMLVHCCTKFSGLFYWWQIKVLIGVVLLSSLIWAYKHLIKHQLAAIDDDSIKIDHCQPLRWNDIENAEERIVRCGFKKLKVIILNPRNNIDYKYNFLQKHNGEFTPFSIPLYEVISKQDAQELTNIISKKVKLIKLEED